MIKASFAITLLRKTANRIHEMTLYGLMIAIIVATAVQFVYAVRSCDPISAMWTLPVDPTSGTCGHFDALASSVPQGIVTIIADIAIGLGKFIPV